MDTGLLTPEQIANTIYDASCHFCEKTINEHIMNFPTTNAFINTAVAASGIYTAIDKLQNGYLTSVDEIIK